MAEESKICLNCGEKFIRDKRGFQNDFSWSVKKYCCSYCTQEYFRRKRRGEFDVKII